VEDDSAEIVAYLNNTKKIPLRIICKPVLTTEEEITRICSEANDSGACIGLIAWMHTFSPAKMWINGLSLLKKPLLHLHTQFNRHIPWNTIDMDFMNLNQSAHGDREFGYLGARLRLKRKLVVGHWRDPHVISRINVWSRAAAAWHDSRKLRVARFGDNMRNVAVTEGDKVAAQAKFGYSVLGYGMGDLVSMVKKATKKEISSLVDEYHATYKISQASLKDPVFINSVQEAARIEIGLKKFLQEGLFHAFTTTFEDLHGLHQLPGLSVQRLMAEGIGFGAEGDWKTAALVRAMKVMASGLEGGVSFMEDYTYHLDPKGMQVLGAHMLEICPSIAAGKPFLEVHPLSIGGKADPARLVFNVGEGKGLNASVLDMGNRFRLIVNEINVKPPHPMPKLPVARVLWEPMPDLVTSAEAWILAGGAHHTAFTKALTPEYLEDYTEMAGIEFLMINEKTEIRDFKKELRFNEVYFLFESGYRH
jgi:L-arabinose isomerase